jgi:hypothetical protein
VLSIHSLETKVPCKQLRDVLAVIRLQPCIRTVSRTATTYEGLSVPQTAETPHAVPRSAPL